MAKGAGDVFQQETKYQRGRWGKEAMDWEAVPDTYKDYADTRRVQLPPAVSGSAMTLDEVLRRRRSVRVFAKRPISLEQLSYLLWAATGIQRVEHGHEFRTAPSAGALYPIETYVVANNVDGLACGVYHYSVREHLLEEIGPGDHGRALATAALGQTMFAEAAVALVWTAIFGRSKWKYGQRAYRYIYMDAGHIGHNLALSAVSLGLGSCQVAALYDDEVNGILGVDGVNESVVYTSVVGHPR